MAARLRAETHTHQSANGGLTTRASLGLVGFEWTTGGADSSEKDLRDFCLLRGNERWKAVWGLQAGRGTKEHGTPVILQQAHQARPRPQQWHTVWRI